MTIPLPQPIDPAALGAPDALEPVGCNREHAHPRDARLAFYPGPHVYLADGTTPLRSVSEVIGSLFEPFDAEAAARRKADIEGRDPQEFLDQWAHAGAHARDAGTLLHAQVERDLLGLPVTTTAPFHFESPTLVDDTPLDVSAELALYAQFRAATPLVPYRTEWRIFDEDLLLAGTIDLLATAPDGSFVIYDWKRSRKLVDEAGRPKTDNPWQHAHSPISFLPDTPFNHYLIQQNLYAYILATRYDIHVSALHLVVLHPAYCAPYVLRVPFQHTLVNNLVAELAAPRP